MIKQLTFIVMFVVVLLMSIILLINTWKRRKHKHMWLTFVMVIASLLLIALAYLSMKVSMSVIYSAGMVLGTYRFRRCGRSDAYDRPKIYD